MKYKRSSLEGLTLVPRSDRKRAAQNLERWRAPSSSLLAWPTCRSAMAGDDAWRCTGVSPGGLLSSRILCGKAWGRIALANLILLSSCGSSQKPEDVALLYEKLSVAGDRTGIRALLSEADSEELARPVNSAYAEDVFGKPDKGELGVKVDSAHSVKQIRDTNYVAVFVTAPNWASVGGQFAFVGDELKDRGEDIEFMSHLPKITRVDTVLLIRERNGRGTRWRLYSDIAFATQVAPNWRLIFSHDSSLAVRSRAAMTLRALFEKRKRSLGPFVDSATSDLIRAAAFLDSVDYAVGIKPSPIPLSTLRLEVDGNVKNRSGRAFEHVTIRIVFSSGEHEDATAANIPPFSQKQPLGFGNWAGAIVAG